MQMLREYQKGDLYKILLHQKEQYQMQYLDEDLLIKGGISFTYVIDDKIIGCAGLAELWDGVYEAWIALDERYKKSHISVLKILKSSLDNLTGHVVRVHAHMNVNTENYKKLMEFLGFQAEAVLEQYFPNKTDCVLYRRLY